MNYTIDLNLQCNKCSEIYRYRNLPFAIHSDNSSKIDCSCGHHLIVLSPPKEPETNEDESQ